MIMGHRRFSDMDDVEVPSRTSVGAIGTTVYRRQLPGGFL